MTDTFEKGEVYFRVTYPDRGRKYPSIESFLVGGKNLSDEDAEETWYFQFADSFAKFGSVADNPGGDRRVCEASRRDLGDMLNCDALCQTLRESAARRRGT